MITVNSLITTIKVLYPTVNWQEVLFNYYCGNWSYTENFLSPIRKNDTSPSMRIFKTDSGDLLAYDYGRNKTYNIWSLVYHYHVAHNNYSKPYSVLNVCELINADLKLEIGTDDIFAVPSLDSSLDAIERHYTNKHRDFQIAVYPKEFNAWDKWYWLEHGIAPSTCKKYNVGAAQKVMFKFDDGDWYTYHTYSRKDPIYYYMFYDSNGNPKTKILRPYSDKKWRTNIDKNDMSLVQGLAQLPSYSPFLFWTSSLKDVMCLYTLNIPSIALHGEGYIPTKEFFHSLASKYPKQYLLYDNDSAGIEATDKLMGLFPFDGKLFVPYGKDPSGMVKEDKGNLDNLQNLFNNFFKI